MKKTKNGQILQLSEGSLESSFYQKAVNFLEALDQSDLKKQQLSFSSFLNYIHIEEFINSKQSKLSKIWNECLGPNPIPFDPQERKDLIEKGKLHPDLKRHIEKWERMKKEGSKWVTGGK